MPGNLFEDLIGVVFRRQKAVVQVHAVLWHQLCCPSTVRPLRMHVASRAAHPWLAGLLVGCPGFPQVPGKGECLWWQPAPGGLMGSGALWESPKKDFFVTVVKWQIQLMSGACRVADNSNIMVYTHVSTPKKHWYFLPARYSSYLGRVVLPIYPKHSKVTIQTDRNDAGLKKRVWNNILQAQHSPPDIWAFNTPMGLYFQVFSVVMTYLKWNWWRKKGSTKN